MATVVNFIDVTLRGAAARTVNLASAQILLTASAPAFHVDAAGLITPETITFTATLIDLDAQLTFNATGAPLTSPTAKSVAVAGAAMAGSSVTVIASATVNGEVYTGRCTISKILDGRNADPSDPADLSPEALLAALEGQITESQLYQALQSRIDLIDAPADTAGSVTARVKAETDARIAAISQASTDNRTYVQQYTFSQQTINDSFSAFGANIQAAYQGYANGAADGALAAAKSFAQSYSYSKADADSSLTATANQLRSEFATLNQGAGATVAWVQEYAYSKAQANDAIASATQQLSTTVSGHTSTLETQAQSLNGLSLQYTVKFDNNGYAAGFGLASTPINGVPTSSFIVLADRFAVALPGQAAKYPFVVGTVNGQTVIGLRGDVVLDGTLNIRTAAGFTGDLDATKGATWGANISGQPQDVSNLVKKSSFEDGSLGAWTANGIATLDGYSYENVPYKKQLVTHSRDVEEGNNTFPITPGETLYFGCWINTQDTPYTSGFGIVVRSKAGSTVSWVNAAPLATGRVWTYVEGSWTVPATMVDPQGITQVPAGATPWMQQDGFNFSGQSYARFAGLWIGRHARGATVGAPTGTKVGNTPAETVESYAAAGKAANDALPDKISKTAASFLDAGITLRSSGAIVAGTATYGGAGYGGTGTVMSPLGFACIKNGVPTMAMSVNGDIFYGGELRGVYGTFDAIRLGTGGYLVSGNGYYGAWNWPGVNQGGGFQISERGMLAGNANDPNMSYLLVEFTTGRVEMPGFAYSGRQLRLDSPLIINPVLSPFNLSITNSQNQYNYTLYRGSTDAYAGLYTVAVSTGNDGASFNWTVSGPWPCWLVQDSNSSRMQLHINMKGGAPLAGDSGDFYINCSATKGGNTVNKQQLATVTAS